MNPEDTLVDLRRRQRRWFIVGLIAIAASPLAWLGITVLGMLASFRTIATTANPTPDELAPGIYVSMFGPLAAVVVALADTALVVWSLRFKRRLDEIESEMGDELPV